MPLFNSFVCSRTWLKTSPHISPFVCLFPIVMAFVCNSEKSTQQFDQEARSNREHARRSQTQRRMQKFGRLQAKAVLVEGLLPVNSLTQRTRKRDNLQQFEDQSKQKCKANVCTQVVRQLTETRDRKASRFV